ncbi:NUDIX domain-containing protein [Pantoea agglomerans]|uniref:NUDIX domain-containing protein n=1 Tax=Enterobacter agglomerans TaxID=549 RepID=UPI003C7BF133
MNVWQWIAGGVEENETIRDAALREAKEEIGIQDENFELIELDSKCSIPKFYFKDMEEWPKDLYVITEHAFAIKLDVKSEIAISDEHCAHELINYKELVKFKTWDSNRTAAWELYCRLLNKGLISR